MRALELTLMGSVSSSLQVFLSPYQLKKKSSNHSYVISVGGGFPNAAGQMKLGRCKRKRKHNCVSSVLFLLPRVPRARETFPTRDCLSSSSSSSSSAPIRKRRQYRSKPGITRFLLKVFKSHPRTVVSATWMWYPEQSIFSSPKYRRRRGNYAVDEWGENEPGNGDYPIRSD